MRMMLRVLGPNNTPEELIAEMTLHEGDLWIEMAQVAYNAAYGYVDATSRHLLASDFLGGLYPFGRHLLTFGRYVAGGEEPECDARVWMQLDQ